MITQIALKFGRVPGSDAETIHTAPITVFVGPNFSGKSRILSEIHQYCHTGQPSATNVIVRGITFQALSSEEAAHVVDTMRFNPPREPIRGTMTIGLQNGLRMPEDQLRAALQQPNSRPGPYCQWYLGRQVLMLNGTSRINHIADQPGGDLQAQPQTTLQVLFKDDERRARVRRIVHDAFKMHLVIDPTRLGHLRIRLSAVAPRDSRQERGIDADAVAFHGAALSIADTSDGVKAFTGIITEIIAGDPRIVLLDEPEAFLHPSLAFSLGKEVALAISGSTKRLFVSTHSPNFVMGCIQSGAPVNIVRLTYRSGTATARILRTDDILKLMRNPLLRSTGVMSGLFYEFVVVTESDADRAFYQEINERLLRFKSEWGIPNCLFLNAQNKQTTQTIVRPLRELGIPTAFIVDIDVIKEGGSVWTKLLDGAFVPALSHQSLADLRVAVLRQLAATGQNMKRDGGIDLLQAGDREAANSLFDQLRDYGIFVVRRGELESWQKSLGAANHGPGWLVDVFEKMGEDPDSAGYVKPSDGDVWAFVNELRVWLTAPNRKGIPV
jgi:predicted ATPase